MPQVSCPSCGNALDLRVSDAGRTVRCPSCQSRVAVDDEFRPRTVKEPRAVRPADPDRRSGKGRREEDSASKVAVKTAALIGGLVAVVATVLGVVVLATRPSAPKPAEAIPDRVEVRPSEPNRPVTQAGDQAIVVAGAGVGLAVALLIFLAALTYAAAVLLMGGWVARDAYARGMGGLPWAVFYYVYQMVVRLFLYPVALFPAAAISLLIPGLGLMVFVGAEVAAWCGFFAYLYARRQGRLSPCPNCRCRVLEYLPACPHCAEPKV